jgi:hypothetical protein
MDLLKWTTLPAGAAATVFVTLAELLLTLRVVLKFFFTSAGGGFVHWAYSTPNVLLEPFRVVFTNPTQTPTNWHVDWVALFAMAVYAAFASLLASLVVWGFGAKGRR